MDCYPSGGYALGTVQQPMATHPNYKEDGREWGTIIGAGKSPNTFGRLLHEDGSFKAFGPLPDGQMGRPDPSTIEGAKQLEGIENFLAPGQMVFKYGVLHGGRLKGVCGPKYGMEQGNRLAQRLLPSLGKVCTPRSDSIAYLEPPYEDANWLFTSLNEDIKIQNGGNVKYYSVTAEWMASGPKGWNPLIYQKTGDIQLL